MYAIEEELEMINGIAVDTFQRDVIEGTTKLEVEAGTTGYKGGCCRDAGSRTYLRILRDTGDFFFGPIKDDDGRVRGITIACCGDAGLITLTKAIDFIQQALMDQICEMDD